MSVATETPVFQKLSQLEIEIRRDEQSAKAKREQVRTLLNQVLSQYGMPTQSAPAAAETKTATATAQKTGPQKRAAKAGPAKKASAVQPKYRDPANEANTWAGRGLPPKWLKEYEAQGRKREDFKIAA